MAADPEQGCWRSASPVWVILPGLEEAMQALSDWRPPERQEETWCGSLSVGRTLPASVCLSFSFSLKMYLIVGHLVRVPSLTFPSLELGLGLEPGLGLELDLWLGLAPGRGRELGLGLGLGVGQSISLVD